MNTASITKDGRIRESKFLFIGDLLARPEESASSRGETKLLSTDVVVAEALLF
jgi:3',5'-cyclic AMP phosphodiesterase CpdA